MTEIVFKILLQCINVFILIFFYSRFVCLYKYGLEACYNVDDPPQPQEMVQLTSCSTSSLEPCVKDLYRLRRKLPFADFLSVDKKYGKLV